MEPIAYTTKDVATLIGVSTRTLEMWRQERRGPQFFREGKTWMHVKGGAGI